VAQTSNGWADLLLHIGDISYATGYSSDWDWFDSEIAPISSRVPYLTCIGNHERDFLHSGGIFNTNDSMGECGVPYEKRYPMPTPALDSPWWSVEYGPIHFLFMSTEHDFNQSSTQWNFLKADLASVNRQRTPWLIFAGHRPMYSNSHFCIKFPNQCQTLWLQKELEEMLLEAKVDLVLWAHVHNYQRTHPIYKNKRVPHGLRHVVIGMAGMTLVENDFYENNPLFAFCSAKDYGYTKMAVTRSKLRFEFIGAHVESDVGQDRILDSFELQK